MLKNGLKTYFRKNKISFSTKILKTASYNQSRILEPNEEKDMFNQIVEVEIPSGRNSDATTLKDRDDTNKVNRSKERRSSTKKNKKKFK